MSQMKTDGAVIVTTKVGAESSEIDAKSVDFDSDVMRQIVAHYNAGYSEPDRPESSNVRVGSSSVRD